MIEIVDIKDATEEEINELKENEEKEDWKESFLRTFLANH